MFHLRASVALGRGKSPARAARIALIKLRRVRVARPWALGGLDATTRRRFVPRHRHLPPPDHAPRTRARCGVRGHRGGRGGLLA